MTQRRQLKDMPSRIARLPRDKRGYPIPKFVQYINGEPDFRIVSAEHMARCVKRSLCWICGDVLGSHKAFSVGPMCCINRISAEPPAHLECATFAAKVCPFLSNPLAKRRERNLPEERMVAGMMIEDNPGMTAIWVTRFYSLMFPRNGVLFCLGDPVALEFYKEGRPASRAEVDATISERFPVLEKIARKDGRGAVAELNRQRRRFDALLDARVPA